MHIGILMLGATILSVSAVASSDPQFHSYNLPPPAFAGGEGGKYANALGVEVWSEGAPARPFKILGTLTDNREIGTYAGPNKSGFVKIIAKGTKAAGGDAAILEMAIPNALQDQATSTPIASRRIREFLNGSGTPQDGEPSYVTRFWVIKYLTSENRNAAPPAN
jgi:hypothetical protein